MRRGGRGARGWAVAIVVAAGVAGRLGWWWRPSKDPIELARQAYERGEWQRAADSLRGPLSAGRNTDSVALRTYARALVRLGRDEAAHAVYGRLGAAAMQ